MHGQFMSRFLTECKVKGLENPSRKQRIIAISLLIVATFILFFVINLRFAGPAILSDEVGYLTKAALFAGHISDSASSWRGGYSLFISPAFMFFSDPNVIWRAVIFINTALFSSSFLLLYIFLRKLFPKKSFWAVFAALVISIVYPSWIVMNGYSFSTPAFLFVFMLSLLVLISSIEQTKKSLIFGVLTGFLYWIHPVGLAVVGAGLLLYVWTSLQNHNYRSLFLYCVGAFSLLIIYSFLFEPWVTNSLTPENYQPMDHYSEIVGRAGNIFKPKAWINSVTIASGRISYLIIATLGIIVFAFIYAYERLLKDKKQNKVSNESQVLLFSCLAILAIVGFTSLTSGTNLITQTFNRVDHWVYGRYSEMVLLPLIGIGFLSTWRVKRAVYAAIFVLLSGLLISAYSSPANTNNVINAITIPSFWPETIFRETRFIAWFTLGGLAIVTTAALGKKFAVVALIFISILCINRQFYWHSLYLSGYSKPSSMVEVVRKGDIPKDCIGFEPGYKFSSYERQRLWMYSYYFYDYRFERMTPNEWLDDSNCSLYLTFTEEALTQADGVSSVYVEEHTGLFLFQKAR